MDSRPVWTDGEQHRAHRVDGAKSTRLDRSVTHQQNVHVRKTVGEPPLAVELLESRCVHWPFRWPGVRLRQLNAETTRSTGSRAETITRLYSPASPCRPCRGALVVRDAVLRSSAAMVPPQVLPTCTNRTSLAASLAVAAAAAQSSNCDRGLCLPDGAQGSMQCRG